MYINSHTLYTSCCTTFLGKPYYKTMQRNVQILFVISLAVPNAADIYAYSRYTSSKPRTCCHNNARQNWQLGSDKWQWQRQQQQNFIV